MTLDSVLCTVCTVCTVSLCVCVYARQRQGERKAEERNLCG